MTDDDVQRNLGFLNAVGGILRSHQGAKKLYGERFSPDFNVLELLNPGETRISRILAWLLDPSGSHGQGGRFLHRFATMALGFDWGADDCSEAKVQTEAPANGRLIDILVTGLPCPIAVENKPWAGDQNKQLVDYMGYLDRSYHGRYRMIYLTPTGEEPSRASIPQEPEMREHLKSGRLQLLAYNTSVQGWLEECQNECQSNRVSAFIDELRRYLRKTFEGVGDTTMSDRLVDEITRSPESVDSAMRVIGSADAVRKKLLADLRQQLLSNLGSCEIKLVDDPWAKYSGFGVSFSEKSPYDFCIEFQYTQFNGLIIGIARKIKGSPDRGTEYDSLKSACGEAPRNDNWLWHRWASPEDSLLPVQRDWQTAAQPWIDIANGRLAARIETAFSRVHDVLTACGVG